ncbi:MAG TPA: hypothetical protein VNA25_30200 [Phycisphaerae bacterium]|nr:hypothetical protein [Phycisphaerae bacterium]
MNEVNGLIALVGLTIALMGLGCLGLCACCVWALHRHWPKTAYEDARDQMVLFFSAYRKGREQVPVQQALAEMERELFETKERIRMKREAEQFAASQRPFDQADMDRPETVAVMGNHVEQ